MTSSNSLTKDPQQKNMAADGIEGRGWEKEKSSIMTNIFGPYPNFSEDDQDVQNLGLSFSVS